MRLILALGFCFLFAFALLLSPTMAQPTDVFRVAKLENDGWDALRSKTIEEPRELLKYKELKRLLQKTTGRDWEKIAPIISGPGSMDYRGDLAIGLACQAHACGFSQMILIADLVGKRFFVALAFPFDGRAPIYPADEIAWSHEARNVLNNWLQGE